MNKITNKVKNSGNLSIMSEKIKDLEYKNKELLERLLRETNKNKNLEYENKKMNRELKKKKLK